jgi:hypothetical protein
MKVMLNLNRVLVGCLLSSLDVDGLHDCTCSSNKVYAMLKRSAARSPVPGSVKVSLCRNFWVSRMGEQTSVLGVDHTC